MKYMIAIVGALALTSVAVGSMPYGGTPMQITGSGSSYVDVWKWDLGGNVKDGGDAYLDASDGNRHGSNVVNVRSDAATNDVDYFNFNNYGFDVIDPNNDGNNNGYGEYLLYTVNCTAPYGGIYNVYFGYRHTQVSEWNRGNAMQLYVDNVYQGAITANRSPNSWHEDNYIANVLLTPGEHLLKIRYGNDGFWHRWTRFEFVTIPEPATALLLLAGLPLLRRRRA